ncbi:hypothetical protein EDF58_1264 [Novosphingobium sp. PhB57]|uniref:hypothetical protein n=1 Tax=Novosphingobium sp. PhB57 TaxID=2485107 RepID=UPI0010463E55|nr:hypothetical protein [Novosphingobium sp. PhB57]TCU51176.1 hypothetical protein EDF58_1264 [Novosphingobium sp. PhB57]
MHEIKNVTNLPYQLETLDGPTRLPAMGSLPGRFGPVYLESLPGIGLYQVREVEELKAALPGRKAGADLTKQTETLKKPAKPPGASATYRAGSHRRGGPKSLKWRASAPLTYKTQKFPQANLY